LEAVFPGGVYIAVRGTSGSRETVGQAALNALSLYFQSQVSSRTDLAESYREEDGAVSQSVQLEQQTVVQTETELFAVRYTDPWRNAGGLWEMTAYIDRNEAWALFEPYRRPVRARQTPILPGAGLTQPWPEKSKPGFTVNSKNRCP
jgi:hypothetical protein